MWFCLLPLALQVRLLPRVLPGLSHPEWTHTGREHPPLVHLENMHINTSHVHSNLWLAVFVNHHQNQAGSNSSATFSQLLAETSEVGLLELRVEVGQHAHEIRHLRESGNVFHTYISQRRSLEEGQGDSEVFLLLLTLAVSRFAHFCTSSTNSQCAVLLHWKSQQNPVHWKYKRSKNAVRNDGHDSHYKGAVLHTY